MGAHAFEESPAHAFVESPAHARNAKAEKEDWVISATVSAYFFVNGYRVFTPADILIPADCYLVYRTRETWLIGGEYKETIRTQNRIIAGEEIVVTYSPDEASYTAAITTVNPEDQTVDELTATHILRVYGGAGTPYPEYYRFEEWLTELNTFESCAATCAALLAMPDITSYPIGSSVIVYYLGNAFGVSVPGLDPGTVYFEEHIATLNPDVPISFHDQIRASPGRYRYSTFANEPLGGQRIDMDRSRVQLTGPVCRTIRRVKDPQLTATPDEIIKCIPFPTTLDHVQTIYLFPPCQRGNDFWYDELWQRRTGDAPTVCELSGVSGADPDCSLS